MSSSFDSTSRKLRRAVRNVKLGSSTRKLPTIARAHTECLEPRQLLTRINGGEFLEFQYFDETRIRIEVTGADTASLDIIGATLDENGNARLNDIPASIYRDGTLVRRTLGGYAGEIGVQQVAGVNVRSPIDVIDPLFQTFPFTAPSGDVAVSALAAKESGALFGLNMESIQRGPNEFRFVQLLSIDNASGNATVVDYLQDKILNAVLPKANGDPQEPGDIKDIRAADWDPQNPNDLYFIATVNQPRFDPSSDAGVVDTDVPLLFRYRAGQVAVMGDFNSSFAATTSEITAMTFLNDGTLLVFGNAKNIEGIGDDTSIVTYQGFFLSDRNASLDPTANIDLVFDGDVIDEFVSMEYIPRDDTLAIVDSNGSDAQLLRVNNATAEFSTGGGRVVALSYGPLVLPNSGSRPIGEELTDLTWNPRVISPFTGERGALMAADSDADQLIFIDYRERFPETGLFNMTLRNSSPDTQVIVTQYVTENNRLVPRPFDGSAGAIRTIYSDDNIDLRGDTGPLYLGIREGAPDDDSDTPEPVVPILTLDSSTFQGSVPEGVGETVTAGIFLPDGGADRILFDGTITGLVNINGPVGLFYAGNLLTGDASGGAELSDRNFYVSGDIRNVIIKGDIGNMPGADGSYASGVDFDVNGKIGQIQVTGDFKAAAKATGLQADTSLSNAVEEIESKPVPNQTVGQLFVTGQVSNASLYNDSAATAQIVGSYYNANRRKGGQVQMVGQMISRAGDTQDFWGIPLVAGQVIDVQLEPADLVPVHMEVYDPEGRLYASDDFDFDPGSNRNLPQQIKIDKPGVWIIRAVAEVTGVTDYSITINRVADISLGGIVAGEDITFGNTQTGRALDITSGDLGTLSAVGVLETSIFEGGDLMVRTGNFRDARADTFARYTTNGATISVSNIPNLFVPKGNVGRLQSVGNMSLNFNQIDFTTQEPILNYGVGVDYQLVSAGGDLSAVLVAKRGIGVIRGNTIGSIVNHFPGYYRNDSDNTGDGFIELIESGSIESGGTIGTFQGGGPAIENGPRGNVKYIVAHDSVFRDSSFGSGPEPMLESQGDPLEIRDDSGALLRIRPLATNLISAAANGTGTGTTGGITGGGSDPFGGYTGGGDPFAGFGNIIPGSSTAVTQNTEGRIIASAYPVRSGGSVVYEVQSTRGVHIETVADGKNSRAEIGRLSSTGSGAPLVFTPAVGATTRDPFGGTGGSVSFDPLGRDLRIIIEGDAPTSVWDLVSRAELAALDNTNVGSFTRITNSTAGEMVNINIESVGYLEVESMGEARSQSGTKIEGNTIFDDGAIDPQVIVSESLTRVGGVATFTRAVPTASSTSVVNRDFFGGALPIGNSYPFSQQKTGVVIGDAIRVRSRRAIANVVIAGQVVRVEANADHKGVKGVFEGIGGPLVTNTRVDFIDIGEGVASSGTGRVGFAGIYALGLVGTISNGDSGSDLRGDVIVGSYLDKIELKNGSIINSTIARHTVFAAGIDTDRLVYFDIGLGEAPDDNDGNPGSLDAPIIGRIKAINLTGNGGVIGSTFTARDLGLINVNGGFGVLNSSIFADGSATIAGIATDGLGVRGTSISGGRSIGQVSARGTTGRLLKISNYSGSVRYSQSQLFDPFSGLMVSGATDLYQALALPRGVERQSGVTNEGIIENGRFVGGRSLGSLLAYQVRATGATVAPSNDLYPMRLNFGDNIGQIRIAESIQGMGITTGRLDSLRINGESRNLHLRTSGRVKELVFGGNVRGTTTLAVSGGSGILDKLVVGGSLYGSVEAAVRIGSIFVGKNLGSPSIRSLGSFGTLEIGRDILAGANVRSSGKMDALLVGGNIQDGAVVRATSFGTQEVDGAIFGDVIVG